LVTPAFLLTIPLLYNSRVKIAISLKAWMEVLTLRSIGFVNNSKTMLATLKVKPTKQLNAA
jgi:hypothetical protein